MHLEKDKFPSVIGVGARRCASSWLHACLSKHPEIEKPGNGLHYFSSKYDMGSQWYLNAFPTAYTRKKRIELSVSYMYPEYAEQAAKRIVQSIPEAKIFACLRDPVERAFSDYRRGVSRLEIDANVPFTEALNRHPELFERGLYGQLLEPYFRTFPRNKILILIYERIAENPEVELRRLCEFIGVPPLPMDAILRRPFSNANAMRWPGYTKRLYQLRDSMRTVIRAIAGDDGWNMFSKRYMNVYHRLLALNHKEESLSSRQRGIVRGWYHSDVIRLQRMLGWDSPPWPEYMAQSTADQEHEAYWE